MVSKVLGTSSSDDEHQDTCSKITKIMKINEDKTRKDIQLYINNIKKIKEGLELLKVINSK